MAAPIWQPGTLYPPGSIVQPASAPPAVSPAIVNPNFDSGLTGWATSGSGVLAASGGFNGANCVSFSGAVGSVSVSVAFPVTPGQQINAGCQIRAFGGSAGNLGDLNLVWFTSGMALISDTQGGQIQQSGGTSYRAASVSGTAPALAAFVKVRADASPAGGGTVLVDAFTWDYVEPVTAAGFIYKAVQPTTGASASTEPVWPVIVSTTVVDGAVTWQCLAGTRVEWEANPLLVSGATEPVWPTTVNGTVADGTIVWTADARRVTDENCPQSKVVAIMASKVFAANEDIVRFSATANPLDWTAEKDAGFLPTGLQQSNSNNMAVLAPYRANLAAFNASSFQNWQVDPDPSAMALLDQMDGIGSTYHKAAVAVGDDLIFLAALGVRSVGRTGASESLGSGDIGSPVDPLVQEAIAAALAAGIEPLGAYYPALGQYWLAFPAGSGAEGWQNLQDSGVSYAFNNNSSPWITLTGSVVTSTASDPLEATEWTLDLGYNGEFRVTLQGAYQVNGSPLAVPSFFRWTFDGLEVFQTNTAVDPLTAWEPSPFSGSNNLSSQLVYFGPEGEEGQISDSYSFLIEVRASAPQTTCFVFTKGPTGNGGTWSRYVFPFNIDAFTLLGNDLYMRHGDTIARLDSAIAYDELTVGGTQVAFPGVVQWNWLDLGNAGSTKHMTGFDIVATGSPSVSVGYNQRNLTQFTPPYAVDADTLTGGIIPLEVVAPSMSLKIDFAAGSLWSLSSAILYVDTLGNGP